MLYKRYIVILSIINVFQSFFLILQVFLFKSIIDLATTQKPITNMICYIAALLAMQIVFRVCYLIIRNHYSLILEVRLKGNVFKSIMHKKYKDMKNIHSAELSNIYLTDIRNIMEAQSMHIPNLFMFTSRLIFAFVALAMLNNIIIIGLSLCGLVLFVASIFYGKYVKKLNKIALKSDDELNTYMQESVENIRLLKVLSSKDVIDSNIDAVLDTNYKKKNKRNRIQISANLVLSSIIQVLYVITLCYAAYLIFKGQISYGTLTALVSLVSYFESPFSAIGKSLSKLYQYRASKERIFELLDYPDEDESLELETFDSIVFDHMSFEYDNRRIYNDFTYTMHKNDIIYIKGESGSGKTTLINILLGFNPYEGAAYVLSNGIKYPISEKTRSLFAYVPQENIIFSGTIRSNFKMFYKNISDEKIIEALNQAHVYQEIIAQGGLDYALYERGRGLSIGQIQRILIAIALASNKPILVMDEFSSALDYENEVLISNLIQELNKTIIMVSHRTINIPNCKMLLVGDYVEH